MWTLLKKLHRARLLSVVGLYRLLGAVRANGVNLMSLLRVAAKLHPDRVALDDGRERVTYTELWHRAESVAVGLHDLGVGPRDKVAIACRSHVPAVLAIFAASRLGAHVFLVNPEMSDDQVRDLDAERNFRLYVHDGRDVFEETEFDGKSVPARADDGSSINAFSRQPIPRIGKAKSGNVVVMTGGTTGKPKAAARKPGVFNFLPPFVHLLCEVNLDHYRTVYVATPIYHGFGLAGLFIGTALGAEMYLTEKFDAQRACELIRDRGIEVVAVVPLMIRRMLDADADAVALSSLKCVITGGAALAPELATETLERLGPILFNLYGTSEAGFCVTARPDVLGKKPDSIGKPVRGVKARVADEHGRRLPRGGVGRLQIKSSWSVTGAGWVETGDLARFDAEGDIFLRGRSDDMIVSGGENVYPVELEHALGKHPAVHEVAAVGIPDVEFGQRLKAVVVLRPGESFGEDELRAWLKPRVARYQIPAVIEFREELPRTPLGKVNRRALG